MNKIAAVIGIIVGLAGAIELTFFVEGVKFLIISSLAFLVGISFSELIK